MFPWGFLVVWQDENAPDAEWKKVGNVCLFSYY